MHKQLTAGIVITLLAGSGLLRAQPPEFQFPQPQKEHEWLGQFVGEWEYAGETVEAPGLPSMKCSGTESVRQFCGFWIVAEGKSEHMGVQVSTMMTLGYDPEKKKYVGTWIDTMMNHMWKYEGTVDPTGRIITLEAEGPSFTTPGKMAKYRDIIEFKSSDHKVLTSSMQGEDGKWTTFMQSDYRRTK